MKRILRVVTLLTLLSSVTLCGWASSISIAETQVNVACNGGSNGSIHITPSGGTGPYTYHWSNGSTAQHLSGLSTGSYGITITDNTGATIASAFTITQPSPIIITKSIVDENCGGQDIGSVTLNISGGAPAFSYIWSNGATTQNLANLTAAVYYLTVTDANNCTTIDSANVTQPVGIAITMAVTDVSCSSGSNGAIATTVQYGVPAYQYLWSDGATTQNRTGLSAGKYSLIVTDAIGCSATDTAIVTQLAGNMSINTSSVNPTCFNGTNGTINITSVVGSTGPFTYLWNDGVVTQSRTGLAAGTHAVTATSSTGCTATDSVVLTQPAQTNVTFHIFPPTCFGGNNGAVNTTASAGTAPYSYLWSNGDAVPDISGLTSGNYTVTVMDFKGCTVAATAVVSAPLQLVVSTTASQLACSGGATGSVFTTVTGGTTTYSYWWGAGVVSANRLNVNAGTYAVTVTDAHGCTATNSATITPYVPMTLTSSQTNIVCYGNDNGSLNITVNNGEQPFSYAWSNGDATANIDSLAGGNYTLTVTDAHSCTITKNCTIVTPPFPITVNSTATDVACFGQHNGSLVLNPINGAPPYNFKWGNGATTAGITNLAVGNYVVTITDSVGCKANGVYTVTQPALITPVATIINDSCFGNNTGSIQLTVTGGYSPFTYAWNDGVDSMHRVKLYAGFYDLTVTDNHACSVTFGATVNQPSQLTLNTAPVNPSCFGGNNGYITATASGGTAAYSYSWGGGISTPTRSNAAVGTYVVTVTDNMGCTTQASSTLTSPSAINITSTTTNVACNGGNNGTITLNVTGGTSPYSFAWGAGVSTQNRNNLTSGNYTVTVTDNAGCTATSTIAVNESTTMTLASSITNVSCFGMNNGSVAASATGGTAPYSYSWSNGSPAIQISNLIAGSYVVTVTDHVGCSTSLTSVVTQPALLSVSSTTSAATCFGSATGDVHIFVSGGTTPYSYNWGGGIVSQNRTNILAGSYHVTVTDSAGCSLVNASTVTQPAQITITPAQTNVSCNGAGNGSIQLSVSGGTGPYTFNWGAGITSQSRSGLAAGSYNVTVTDANLCSAADAIVITQPNVLTVHSAATNVACFGQTTGGITLTVTGGTANYTYSWNTGAATQNLVNFDTGSYAVTVTDANACSVSASAVITQPVRMSTSIFSVVDASCYGASNGGVNIQINGGTPAYSYAWSTGATTQNLSGVAAGTYHVSVVDANGCTTSSSINVTQPSQISMTSSITNVLCHGGNTGSIMTFVNGGNGGFTYSWSNGATTGNINNVSTGTYTLSVSDAMNCSTSFSMQLTQPAQVAVTTTQTNVTCNGGNTGTASVDATGGTGAYAYLWSNGQTTAQITQLAQGNYLATVSDANACSVTTTVDISQINSMVLNLTTINVGCFGQATGGVNASVSGGAGGYSYSWSNGATTSSIANVPSGNYDVTVTDANHCNTSSSSAVSQQNAITVVPAVTNITCFGSYTGNIQLTTNGGAGGYQYLWSNGSSSQNMVNLAAGNYGVTVKDANACSVSNNFTVTQPAQINIVLSKTDLTCNGANNGSITSLATGGTGALSYVWSNTSTTQNIGNLPAGSYTLTVQDAGNCTAASSANIIQPSAIVITPAPVNVACNGGNTGSVGIQVSGGAGNYTFNWSNQSTAQQLSNLVAGNYAVTVIDASSCSATSSVIVTQPSAINITSTRSNYACASKAGIIDLSVTGGTSPFTYNWQDGNSSQNRTNLAAGSYAVTTTDANHCTQTSNITISQIPQLNASLTPANVTCFGGENGSLAVSVTGGANPYNYSWSNASTAVNIQQLQANTYSVVVTDANGCTISASAAISQPSAIQVSPTITNVICNGQSNGAVSVTVTGGVSGYNYKWSNNSSAQSISDISAGSYQLTVTDAANCTVVLNNITVNQPAPIALTATVTPVGCSGQNDGSVKVNVAGGTPPYDYNWSNSAKADVIDNLGAGSYSVTVVDYNGCNTIKIVEVTSSAPLAVTATSQNTACIGVTNGSVSLSVSGGTEPYTYDWSNAESGDVANDLNAGNYKVTVTDARGCSALSGANILVSYELTVHATASSGTTSGGQVQLSAITNVDHSNSYNWTPANVLTCSTCASTAAAPQQTTLFTVNVVDANGCKASDTVTVDVNNGTEIFIPNVFTPNGDGVNDQFKMFGNLSNVNFIEMAIFDRWGEKVFETNDANFEWDGSFKGEPAPVGVYIYAATIVFSNGTHRDLKGSITLLK